MELFVLLVLGIMALMIMWEVGAWLIAVGIVLVVVNVLPWWALVAIAVIWLMSLSEESEEGT